VRLGLAIVRLGCAIVRLGFAIVRLLVGLAIVRLGPAHPVKSSPGPGAAPRGDFPGGARAQKRGLFRVISKAAGV